MPDILVERLAPEVQLPARGSTGAAGYDVRAHFTAETPVKTIGPAPDGSETIRYWHNHAVIAPGHRALVPTGLRVALPAGWELQVRPRSGLALNAGITVLNTPGTIDSDYRGEVGILLLNTSSQPFVVMAGDRIAQLVVAPTFDAHFTDAPVTQATARADGGFGSTGTA